MSEYCYSYWFGIEELSANTQCTILVLSLRPMVNITIQFRLLVVWQNLLEKPEDKQVQQQNALSMVQCKLMKQIEILNSKSFDDEDMAEDIAFIAEFLETSVQDLRYSATLLL